MALEQPPTQTVIDNENKTTFSQRWRNYFDYLFRFLKSDTALVKTDTFSTNSTSWTSVTGMALSITPSRNSSKYLIECSLNVGLSADHSTGFKIIRTVAGASTDISLGDASGSRDRVISHLYSVNAAGMATVVVRAVDTPNTNQLVTYTLQVKNIAAGTVYLNRTGTDTNSLAFARGSSTMSIKEIN